MYIMVVYSMCLMNRLDTVFYVSVCNRTIVETVYLLRAEPEVINVSKVVLLHVET